MRLTKEKLIALWKNREQIFNNPINASIIKRYKEVASLFKKLQIVIFHLTKKLRSIP